MAFQRGGAYWSRTSDLLPVKQALPACQSGT
jgi:hypothetical protein